MFFEPAQKTHEKFLTKLTELEDKEAESLKDFMVDLELYDSGSQRKDKNKELRFTNKIEEFKIGYVNRGIESFDINVYPAHLNSNFHIPPVSSPDFCLTQKKLFKQILFNINAKKDISHLDYATLIAFFRNLFVTVAKGRYRGFSNQNPKFIYNIIKFGINLIDLAQEWKNNILTQNETQSKFVHRTDVEISFFLVHSGLWLAEDEIANAQSVLELLYAETFVEWAHNTYQKLLKLNVAHVGIIKDMIHSIYAKYALIALKKNDLPTFLIFADKIGVSMDVVDHNISEVLIAAALQYKATHPLRALSFLNKAERNLDAFSSRPLMQKFNDKLNELRQSCVQMSKEIIEKQREQLKKKIREHCPIFKVKTHSTP
jgi:hypothetical protein